MRRKGFLLVAIVLLVSLINQKIEAQTTNWYGELKVSVQLLPITLKIEQSPDTTIIMMGSPSQTKEMFGVTKQRLSEDSILFTIKSMGVVFRGKYNETKDTIFATFKQGFLSEDLVLAKTDKTFELKRPQEPMPPYSYIEEELSFKVPGVNYDFKGTLTIPSKDKTYPCVILVTGSGLQNRDEEIFGHKPFKVIADYLTSNGIGVFRYDDRGWGIETVDSSIINATTLDYTVDAMKAFEMLKSHPNIDKNNIGMLGHSEGGAIVSIAASQNPNIKFIVLLAGPGMKGIDVLLQQNKVFFEKAGMPKHAIDFQVSALKKIYSLTKKNLMNSEINKRMDKFYDKELGKLDKDKLKDIQFTSPAMRTQFNSQLSSPWMRTFLSLDPSDYLKKVKQPVFAINGTNDIQVLYQYNLPEIEKALKKAKNNHYQIITAVGMNHLFQESKTGMIDEYSSIEQTISPIILLQIKDFIKENTKAKK
ncbi:MAG: alpha/beta fold hydrolase [Bacteroidales bacterium]|nr:alpha/beta fold hydrolase [Bacteroidales bacterium]